MYGNSRGSGAAFRQRNMFFPAAQCLYPKTHQQCIEKKPVNQRNLHYSANGSLNNNLDKYRYPDYSFRMEIKPLTDIFRIVVVDDDPEITETIMIYLEEEENIRLRVTQDPEKALKLVKDFHPNLLIADLMMPVTTGIELLKAARQIDPALEVVLMTAHASAQTAVEAMKEGAYDYLIKPFKMIELRSLVSKISRTRALLEQNRELKQQLNALTGDNRIIGRSKAMDKIRRLASMIIDNDASILITGESGTGKSVLARVIHDRGNRSNAPFVTIECGAIPATLLESELFGYEKGAFTGADARKMGRMEKANNGTLFLDEIADMPLDLQAKMLRVLQEKELNRVGGNEPVKINIRLIAATNKDLSKLVKEGGFREDLFYRLNVIPIHLPPLREREEDLPELAEMLSARICARHSREPARLSEKALQQIAAYPWPGNIRELENILERTLVFDREPIIKELLLPDENLLVLE